MQRLAQAGEAARAAPDKEQKPLIEKLLRCLKGDLENLSRAEQPRQNLDRSCEREGELKRRAREGELERRSHQWRA